MPFHDPISFRNYRSIRDEIRLPFSRKITFVVGPNNSGKSNVLRFVGILFNQANSDLDESGDFDSQDKSVKLTIELSKEKLAELLSGRNLSINYLNRSELSHVRLNLEISKNAIRYPDDQPDLDSVFGQLFSSRNFLNEFGQSGPNNAAYFISYLNVSQLFSGTSFVPNVRFITKAGEEPPQFVNFRMPGETIAFGSVIKRLAEMDRPDTDKRYLREQKQSICDFMAYCLEASSVKLEVPESKQTIHVDIGGDERPIGSFGTGVEQLLMIGIASMGFKKKMVLIDEPELNLHPRAQKRLISYLDRNAEAQFVIATHSAAILDAAEADIVQTTLGPNGTSGKTIRRNHEKYQAIRDLGHSPSELVQTRYAIWVEGPSDRIYLKHWIARIDPELVEGIDYTVLYYGGRVLAQHSFEDVESDLVKAVTLCRSFAVVIDSDRKPDKPNINATKTRIRDEVEREGGLCWITEGREIENYLAIDVITQLAATTKGVAVPTEKREQVLDPEKVSKVEFARKAIAIPTNEWPMDLKKMITDLVHHIRNAR